MSTKNLSLYLNDHLAGSVSALELLDHMISTSGDKALEHFFRDLRGDIQKDQEVLRKVMGVLGIEESGVRQAVAWVMEKVGRAKLPFAGGVSEIDLVQALEGLLMGITGKKSLWHSLSGVQDVARRLEGIDLANLEQRAENQCERVRAKSELAVKDAFKAV